MSILKVIYLVNLFFRFSYLLVPKIEICLNYFLDKNPKKQSFFEKMHFYTSPFQGDASRGVELDFNFRKVGISMEQHLIQPKKVHENPQSY